ncbi:recombinase family protein [Streptomyces sp. NPDC002221]|uniref:recombinase family protein n=1 Tax=Streptomyces sp. NPDC002221 TaxID=3364639 RepID=UPI003694F180
MYTPFGAPIDLSDLPSFDRTKVSARRSAFLGRVSTKDNQDPSLSIPRQVSHASARLDDGEEFVAHYWDVESGMLPPELRGLGTQEMYDGLAVSVQRDGGLQDLLACAEVLGITHVLAESSDRVARAMLTSLTVEHDLEAKGIEVVYADEPVGGTESGRLRTRRYSQVDAEIYRAVLMEKSMGGQIQHAVQGWNHGYAPYPYIREVDETAPRKTSRFGMERPKQKLVPHPDSRRFDAARELCRLRREEHLKAADIITILEADPERYPIEDRWTQNRVSGLIENPKLTGYQVYNRRAKRTGRPGLSPLNPMSEWVWSPRPVHDAVISVEEWKTAQEVTAAMRAGAANDGPLLRIRTAARRLGLPVTLVSTGATHKVYRIGDRQVVLPIPVLNGVAQQVIDDMERQR